MELIIYKEGVHILAEYIDFYSNTINAGSPFCDYCEQRLRQLIVNKFFEGN